MILSTKATHIVNDMLQGEIAATETYQQALAKYGSEPGAEDLRRIHVDHREFANRLRQYVHELGDQPSQGSQAWGAFAKAVEKVATLLGNKTALQALRVGEENGRKHYSEAASDWATALVIAPPSARASPWLRRFGQQSTAVASGWMLIRGARRRQALDRGFVLSDHVDWAGLMSVIEATGAERILVTHGYVQTLVRWLREAGYDAHPLETRFAGDEGALRDTGAVVNSLPADALSLHAMDEGQ